MNNKETLLLGRILEGQDVLNVISKVAHTITANKELSKAAYALDTKELFNLSDSDHINPNLQIILELLSEGIKTIKYLNTGIKVDADKIAFPTTKEQ